MYCIIRQFFQFGVSVLLHSICSEDELTSLLMQNILPQVAALGGAGFCPCQLSYSVLHADASQATVGEELLPQR